MSRSDQQSLPQSVPPNGLFSRGMSATLVSQFFSAFGDNALLFAIIALIKQLSYPDWSKPVLQIAFVMSFIVTAPFVGQFADSFSKGRVMLLANGLKLLGAMSICLAIDPFIGYILVGIGAATYSPAKYGILGDLTSSRYLVKANGLIEASTIAAILLGSLAGGYLADIDVNIALYFCGVIFILSIIANLFIPNLAPVNKNLNWNFIVLLKSFAGSVKQFYLNPVTRITLIGTSLLWGAGITLRFLLIDWVPLALGMTDNKTPTILNAIVAIGIVIGAGLAGKMIRLENTLRAVPAGILMGITIVGFTLQNHIIVTYILLIVIGILGGLFLIPLNALLQDIGKRTIGAGRAIAVQNFGEYSAMMIMLGIYSIALADNIAIITIGIAFGVLFALAIACLWISAKRRAVLQ